MSNCYVFLAVVLFNAAAIDGEPTVDDIFDQLTSHELEAKTEGKGFSHRVVVRLERNGTYRWSAHSDVLERDDKGQWSFEFTAGAGALRLSESGDLPFRIVEGQPVIKGFPTTRGNRIEYDKDDLALTAKDLKPVEPTKEGQRLTKQAWVKINPFNDYGSPQQIEFMSNQRYRAKYRDATCEHGGTWSLIKDHASRYDLDSHADENECDQRGGSAGLSHYYLKFDGDLLLLGDGYAPADKKPKKSIFYFDRYGNSIQTRGEFAGEFVAGKPMRMDFMHRSADGSDYELKSFAIGMQKYKRFKGGYTADGETHWLVQKDLTGHKVASDKSHAHRVEFTPPAAGEMGFVIHFKYANQWQPYDAQHSYVVLVK